MFDILESEQGKPFKIRGIFMKKNSVSSKMFHYSDKLMEATVKKIQESLDNGGSYPINMMADHPSVASNKTLSIIGKITAAYIDGDNAIMEAEIANTSVGKDVQELIRGDFVKGLSIRANNPKIRNVNIGGKMVKDVLEMELRGVDLVPAPGVNGAGITDIIESDDGSDSIFISIEESEIEDVTNVEEENTLDLKELKLKHPELIEALKGEFKQLFEDESKVTELQESFDALTSDKGVLETKLTESETANGVLTTSVTDLTAQLEAANLKLTESEAAVAVIQESEAKAKRDSHISDKLAGLKYADSVKSKLKEKVEVLESVEAIDALLESEVAYLDMIIKESTTKPSGKGRTGDNGKGTTKLTKLEEEEAFINMVNEIN
jgi:hypothetical protein